MQRRYRKSKPKKEELKSFRINEKIFAPKILLINEDGGSSGIVATHDALAKARESGLDLIEVNPVSNPPVARIMDFGQYKYELEKKNRKTKAHQKTSETKALRLTFRIKGQDLELRRSQTLKFLSEGNKVKIDIVLHGREKAHRHLALDNIKNFISSLGNDIKIIQPVSSQGEQISAILSK